MDPEALSGQLTDQDLAQLRATFVRQSEELLHEAEQSLLHLEQYPEALATLDEIFRAAHTIKGDARMVGLIAVAEVAHEFEETLILIREGRLLPTAETITGLLEGVDTLRRMVAGRDLGTSVVTTARIHPAAAQPGATPVGAVGSASGSTLRVPISRLDRMLDLAGEIAIGHGRIGHLLAALPPAAAVALIEHHEGLAQLHRQLQDCITQTRMIAVGSALRPYGRTVRESARALGKEAVLEIEGGEVEVDTRVLELLHDPLVHMVRNAMAHGIEPTAVRLAAGKPASGTIKLAASHEHGQLVLRLSDDGQGLDPLRIAARARELGLHPHPEQLEESALFAFIFAPGFSTASEVTELAGRGVGLDVVRHNIDALHGVIEVTSTEGEGTTFILRLPLTLAIIDGFHVTVGETTYVIPLTAVLECLPHPPTERGRPSGVLDLRGAPVPYIRLRDHLGARGAPSAREHAVVVQHRDGRAALVVDALLGSGQTVIKGLGDALSATPALAGATVLDDGRVALILDVPALLLEAARAERPGLHPTPFAGPPPVGVRGPGDPPHRRISLPGAAR